MSEQPVSERIKILLMEYAHGNKAYMGRSLGISGQAIADLIEGKKGGPSFSVLQKMLILYSEIRAEWLVLGEEPMRKTKVELEPSNTPVIHSVDTEGHAVHSSLSLTDEQKSQIIQAAYSSLFSSEEIKRQAAFFKAEAQAEANLLTSVYCIGKPDSTRPYNGLLTERLNISEEEARALILNGEIQAKHIGSEKHPRITNYRISELAVRGYLQGLSVEEFRAKMAEMLK
jgi:hypothetical protein